MHRTFLALAVLCHASACGSDGADPVDASVARDAAGDVALDDASTNPCGVADSVVTSAGIAPLVAEFGLDWAYLPSESFQDDEASVPATDGSSVRRIRDLGAAGDGFDLRWHSDEFTPHLFANEMRYTANEGGYLHFNNKTGTSYETENTALGTQRAPATIVLVMRVRPSPSNEAFVGGGSSRRPVLRDRVTRMEYGLSGSPLGFDESYGVLPYYEKLVVFVQFTATGSSLWVNGEEVATGPAEDNFFDSLAIGARNNTANWDWFFYGVSASGVDTAQLPSLFEALRALYPDVGPHQRPHIEGSSGSESVGSYSRSGTLTTYEYEFVSPQGRSESTGDRRVQWWGLNGLQSQTVLPGETELTIDRSLYEAEFGQLRVQVTVVDDQGCESLPIFSPREAL